jgi:membrane protein
LGDEAVRGQLEEHLKSSVGPCGALAVQEMVANARQPDANAWASIGSLLMLLVGAGGVFGQLKEALNTAWGVEEKPGRGIRGKPVAGWPPRARPPRR